jgi:TonB family protein
MRKFWSFFALAAFGPTAATALAEPLQPTGKWQLHYEESSCVAQRPYGDHMLGIQPSPLGLTMRFVIVGPGGSYRARQYDSTIELFDGGAPVKASTLVYPLKQKKGHRGITTILPVADAARVEKAQRIRISSKVMSADLWVGSTAALHKELATCMDDLRKHWGMVDGKLPEPPKRAVAVPDVRKLFRDDDYPEDALDNNQTGSTTMLLMIDAKGAVADCITVETSGVATIDAMSCQVMRERARFNPALDANGKPTRDTYVTPPIRYKMEW